MLTDGQGFAVTTDRPETIAGIDRLTRTLLCYGTDHAAIFEAVDADPASATANTLAAAVHLFSENPAGVLAAEPFLQAAEARTRHALPRERLLTRAVRAWASGRIDHAAGFHWELALTYPRDLCAAKIGQYHLFNRGDAAGLLAIADMILPANQEIGFAHGMAAFALEQSHRLDKAEAAGRLATTMERRDPWAHHAVAHVMETQGRVDEGIAWMEGLADAWDHCNSFMLTHNWWHIALFHIDRDDPDHALALYDHRVWGVWKEYSQDQVNAVSLLGRLELRGVDVGDRWQDLAAYLEPRTADHVNGFLDLHYVYGLARAGRDGAVADLLASMTAHAAMNADRSWADVALPAARALVDHARGAWQPAADALGPLLHRLAWLGGSHAQRDLFHQIHLDAVLRAGQVDDARPILLERQRARPGIGAINRQLAAIGGAAA